MRIYHVCYVAARKKKIVTLKCNRDEHIVKQWGERDYDFVCVLIGSSDVCMCAFVSSLCLSLCPLNWVKGAFRRAGELFKSCVWVLVCVSGSVGGATDRFTPHVQERWRPFPRQAISLFSVSLVGWLAVVQFNFFRAHRLVLSPPHPFFWPPTKNLLSYSLPP